jgi:hypothetical protein
MNSKKQKKVYAEIGFGNNGFFSTEIEEGKKEYRVRKIVIPKKVQGVHIRVATKNKTFILSTYNGLIIKEGKKKFKFLFGIQGIGLK